MENMNNQGKRPQQVRDSEKIAWYGVIGMTILLILMTLLTSCVGTYYLSDAEYDDAKEEHLIITYYNNQIYWGWYEGYWYYYGIPHQNPWYYYYNICPPSHYHINTHIKINRPKKIIVHRNNKLTSKPLRNNKVLINNGSKRTNKTTIRRKPKK